MNTYDPHGTDDLSLPPDEPGAKQGAAADAAQPASGTVKPVTGPGADLASNVIRQKLDQIYAEEPTATKELSEAAAKARAGRSKHQQFMYNLGTSGKDLATIQTEWHHYYESLPDKEKHDVWREFYASQSSVTEHGKAGNKSQALAKHKHQAARRSGGRTRSPRSSKDIQQSIRNTVSAGGKLEAKHNLQSILFGLGLGAIVLIIFLFGFFNEVVLAPFIQPSRASAATPLIVGNDNVAPSSTPQVIIPKINVQIPVNYNETSTNEATIENDLENGVVHYPNTAVPGQDGNAAFFGHSSNNIFNKGKYKFAFVLLHTLVQGDTFYLTYNGKLYVYKVISRQIVSPSNVGVLNAVAGQRATATLITCDPPGTSLNRLVVVGQQISPDPAGNAQASTDTAAGAGAATAALPGNGPTLWGRFISTTGGKAAVVVVLLGGGVFIFRRVNDRLVVRA